MTLIEKSKFVTEVLELVMSKAESEYEAEEILRVAYNSLSPDVRRTVI